MAIFVVLMLIVFAALLVVSVLTSIQRRKQLRRLQQRRLRLEVDSLNEIIGCLELTLPNQLIARHLNDRVVELFREMLELEDYHPERIQSYLKVAEERGQKLSNPLGAFSVSYQRESDAQIAKAQNHLLDALHYLPQLVTQGKLREAELDAYQTELRWAHLMIPVISYIAQGKKSATLNDRFTAQAYYRKAQTLLMESLHNDPRRLRLIKELSELIEGSRPDLSREFRDSANIM